MLFNFVAQPTFLSMEWIQLSRKQLQYWSKHFMCICVFCWCAHFGCFWKWRIVGSSCIGSCLDNGASQRDSSQCPSSGMSFHKGGTCTQPNPQEFQPSQLSHSPWPSGLKEEAQFRLRISSWSSTFFRVSHHRMCPQFTVFTVQTSEFQPCMPTILKLFVLQQTCTVVTCR